MDYPYYAAVPQPYHYADYPPTPSGSDEVSESKDAYDQLQNFHGFQNVYTSQQLPNNPSPPLLQHEAVHQIPAQAPGYGANEGYNDEAPRRGSSNSDDEENMTPVQQKRKAQNRAAQRAFRERKEQRVKDLEAKLANAEKAGATTTEENARLKAQLQKAVTENEILKATSSHPGPDLVPQTGPMSYSPTKFFGKILSNHDNKVPSHRIVTSPTGQKLFGAAATWDYVLAHPLFKRGLVDIEMVSQGLQGKAICDGQGPVYEENIIIAAIESSVANGSDELL